jgi:hypothetical protein
MIRFDGYYLTESLEVYNGRSKEKSSYSFNAYIFLKNGLVKIRTKHDYLKNLSDFTLSDFDDNKCVVCNFRIEKNEVIIKPNSKFGSEYSLVFESEKEIKISSSEQKLVFINWEKINNMALNEINNAMLIKSLYEPFYHEKYKVYYE